MAVASTIVPECFSGDIMRRSCTTSGNGCHRNTSSLFKNPMVSSEINILFPSVSFHQTRSSSMSSIHATASRSSCDSRFRQVVTDEKGDQRIAIDPGVDDEWKIRIPGCEGDNWKNEIGAYYKEMLIKINPDNPLFMRNYGKFCGKYIPATSKELSKLHCYVLGSYAHFLWDAEDNEQMMNGRSSPSSSYSSSLAIVYRWLHQIQLS